MEAFKTALFAKAAPATNPRASDGARDTHPRVRFGRESAPGEREARLASAWRSDAQFYRGAIDSPFFADV